MGLVHGACVGHAIGIGLMRGREGDVATVEDGSDETEEGGDGFGIEADGGLFVVDFGREKGSKTCVCESLC